MQRLPESLHDLSPTARRSCVRLIDRGHARQLSIALSVQNPAKRRAWRAMARLSGGLPYLLYSL